MRNCSRIVIGLMFAIAGDAFAGPVTGTVRTQARAGVQAATAIVYAEPLDGGAPKKPGTFKLTQKEQVVRAARAGGPIGSTVAFPNEDTIFHNVFSLSGPQPFDLGFYRARRRDRRRSPRRATYRVFCNIHPQMTALILVVSTPYVTWPMRTARSCSICRLDATG